MNMVNLVILVKKLQMSVLSRQPEGWVGNVKIEPEFKIWIWIETAHINFCLKLFWSSAKRIKRFSHHCRIALSFLLADEDSSLRLLERPKVTHFLHKQSVSRSPPPCFLFLYFTFYTFAVYLCCTVCCAIINCHWHFEDFLHGGLISSALVSISAPSLISTHCPSHPGITFPTF